MNSHCLGSRGEVRLEVLREGKNQLRMQIVFLNRKPNKILGLSAVILCAVILCCKKGFPYVRDDL